MERVHYSLVFAGKEEWDLPMHVQHIYIYAFVNEAARDRLSLYHERWVFLKDEVYDEISAPASSLLKLLIMSVLLYICFSYER